MSKAEDYVKTLISIVMEVKTTYETNEMKIEQLNGESCDLEHEIELSTFNASKGYELAKELQRVKKERRRFSDENVMLKSLYEFFITNKINQSSLGKVLSATNKEVNDLKSRKYRPRVRVDLTIPTVESSVKI